MFDNNFNNIDIFFKEENINIIKIYKQYFLLMKQTILGQQ